MNIESLFILFFVIETLINNREISIYMYLLGSHGLLVFLVQFFLLKVGDKVATLTPTIFKFVFKFNINGSSPDFVFHINRILVK